jgi:hypothetical protein
MKSAAIPANTLESPQAFLGYLLATTTWGTVGYDPENSDLLGRRMSLKVERAW